VLHTRLGESGSAAVLGIAKPVLHRILQGFAISRDTEDRVWMALQEQERRARALEDRKVVTSRAVVTKETSPGAAMTRLEATRLFRERVWDRPRDVDPGDDVEWETLAYGFFLGLGFEPTDAKSLAFLVIDSDFYETT